MKAQVTLVALASILLASCGSGGGSREMLTIQPSVATATHAAMPPGNMVTFTAFDNPSCPMMGQCMAGNQVMAAWTTSDMMNTSVMTNANGTGTVTCINATPMMVVVTATANSMAMAGTKVSASANLMCQ